MTNLAHPARPVLGRAVRMIVLVLAVTAIATMWLQLGGRSALAERVSSPPAKAPVLLVNANPHCRRATPPHSWWPSLARSRSPADK